MKKKKDEFGRQAMVVSPKQLREIADELEQQIREDLFMQCMNDVGDLKFQVNIINKTPECSDTWEFETGGERNGKNNRKCRKDRNASAS